jgi:hypothetical protein
MVSRFGLRCSRKLCADHPHCVTLVERAVTRRTARPKWISPRKGDSVDETYERIYETLYKGWTEEPYEPSRVALSEFAYL